VVRNGASQCMSPGQKAYEFEPIRTHPGYAAVSARYEIRLRRLFNQPGSLHHAEGKAKWRLEASEGSDGAKGRLSGWHVQPLPKERST